MAYKTFNRFLKSLSIKKKLTYTLIPVILVTYLLSVGSVYMVSFHETKSIVNQQAQTLANQRTQLVDSYLDQLRTETEIFMFDTAFQKRFRTNRSTLSLSQQEELNKEITQYMYSMIISNNVYVESITLINNHLDSYNWHMDGRNSYSAYISRLLSLSDTLTELDGGILYTYDKLDQGVVTIARLIKDPIYDRKVGILMLDFNLGFLNKMTGVRTKDQSAADALLAIADQNGDIIYNDSPFSKDELFSVQNGSARLSADGMQYQIDSSKSDANDWILYSIINETALYRNINRNLVWQVTLILISMLLIFAVILLVSRTLSGQFRHFIETVSHTTAPDEHALITVDSEDEFRDLAQVYNDMILRINHLIETVYTKELLLKNAELKAFQAQINPHFLYNTLDCINGLVDLDRPNDIKKTITALASIMRMSIKGKEILTVRENIRYINEYMFIEQLRYPDNLIFLNEIPEEMMEFYIPKLILQPILENSVIHGTSSLLGKGMIALLGKEEPDALIFTVSDNGVGFPEAILQLFRESPENHLDDTQTQSRLGLLNIQKRIHLMYGTEYGLTLQNLPAGGSRVTIRLPKITTP